MGKRYPPDVTILFHPVVSRNGRDVIYDALCQRYCECWLAGRRTAVGPPDQSASGFLKKRRGVVEKRQRVTPN